MKYYILFCLVVLIGCSKKKTSEGNIILETINIEVNKATFSTNISPYLQDEVSIIALETNDSCLVSNIIKTEFYKDNIYISDGTTQKLYRFNSSGLFLNSIGKLGGGPEEYAALGDFTIINDLIYIQDKHQDKIMVYNDNNEFVSEIRPIPSIYFDEFTYQNNKLYFITNYKESKIGTYNIYEMDMSSKSILGYLEYDKVIEYDQLKWGLNKYISKTKDETIFTYSNNDILYCIDEEGIKPLYKVRFSERKIPKEELVKGGAYAMEFALTNNFILGIDNLNNSKDYIFFSYSDGSKGRDVIYDKKNRESYTSEWLFIEDLGNLYVTDYFTSNEEFAFVQDAYLFKDLWERQYSIGKFKDEKYRDIMSYIYNNLKEDDNPILFRFKFR